MKVKQLYVYISDYDGNTYLIKKEDASAFEKALSRIEDSYSEHKDEDIYYEEFNALIEYFEGKVLEGEQVFVVLPEDIIEGVYN